MTCELVLPDQPHHGSIASLDWFTAAVNFRDEALTTVQVSVENGPHPRQLLCICAFAIWLSSTLDLDDEAWRRFFAQCATALETRLDPAQLGVDATNMADLSITCLKTIRRKEFQLQQQDPNWHGLTLEARLSNWRNQRLTLQSVFGSQLIQVLDRLRKHPRYIRVWILEDDEDRHDMWALESQSGGSGSPQLAVNKTVLSSGENRSDSSTSGPGIVSSNHPSGTDSGGIGLDRSTAHLSGAAEDIRQDNLGTNGDAASVGSDGESNPLVAPDGPCAADHHTYVPAFIPKAQVAVSPDHALPISR